MIQKAQNNQTNIKFKNPLGECNALGTNLTNCYFKESMYFACLSEENESS